MRKQNNSVEKLFYFTYLFFILSLLILSLFPQEIYAPWASRGGLIKNCQIIFLFLGGYLCIKIFLLRKKNLLRLDIVILLLGALLFLVFADTIRWGQWIIGLKPLLIENELNNQRQWDLHNMNFIEPWIYHAIHWFIFIFACLLPVATYLSRRIKKLCVKIGVPLMPPVICLAFWLSMIIIVLIPWLRYGIPGVTGAMNQLKQLRELILEAGLFFYIFVEYFYLLKYKKSYDF